MLIDFEKIEETRTKNFAGGEKEFIVRAFSDDHNRILLGKLEPGASLGQHSHMTSSESLYVINGQATITFKDGITEIIKPGQCHHCPKGNSHTIANQGNTDLIFFSVIPQQ